MDCRTSTLIKGLLSEIAVVGFMPFCHKVMPLMLIGSLEIAMDKLPRRSCMSPLSIGSFGLIFLVTADCLQGLS